MTELIYVFEGKNSFLVNQKVEEKIKSLAVDPFNVIHYDLNDTDHNQVLEDLRTVTFFFDKKVIVVKNILEVIETKEWEQYFKNPNPDVYLIIILKELVENKSEIEKLLFKYAYVEKIQDLNKEEYPKFVKDIFKAEGYEISSAAIDNLLERTNYDFDLLSQEKEKLIMFTFDSKEITEKDVRLLVSRNLEENIYELTNALLFSDKAKTIQIFYDLTTQNEDPIRILNNIVSKVRELLHTKLLIKKGYTQNELADHFQIKSGRAYYLVKNANSVDIKVLENMLEQLAKLDFEIKSGKVDKKMGLELFLLGG